MSTSLAKLTKSQTQTNPKVSLSEPLSTQCVDVLFDHPGTNPKVRPKMIRKDNAVCASLSDAIVKEQGRPDYQTTAR